MLDAGHLSLDGRHPAAKRRRVDSYSDDVVVAEFDGPAHIEVDVHLATHG